MIMRIGAFLLVGGGCVCVCVRFGVCVRFLMRIHCETATTTFCACLHNVRDFLFK